MSLFLEVKKFINSEHTGHYVEIQIPIQLDMPEPQAKKEVADIPEEEKSRKKGLWGRKPRLEDDDFLADEYDDGEAVGDVTDADAADQVSQEPAEPGPVQNSVEDNTKDDTGNTGNAAEEPVPDVISIPIAHVPQSETVKIHYMDEGIGEPLILVHTVGQSLYTWRNLFYELSENYRVIVLDLPGHGYSDRPVNFNYTIEEMGEVIRMFMDAMGIESAHFVGFSLGYAYVLEFARKYPERTGKLVLLAPGGMVPEMPLAIRMIDSSLFGFLACRLYGIRTVENILSECFFDLTTLNADVVSEYYRPASDIEARKAIRLSLHNFDDENVIANLRSMDQPVLILWGNEDKWRKSNSDSADMLHAALHRSSASVIRNAGHLMHEEKAEKVIAAILEYIPVIVRNGGEE